MLKNYLKIALRSIIKGKVFFLINVLGLSVGIMSSIVIAAFIVSEASFDKFHSDADRIYRIVETTESPRLGERDLANVGGAVGPVAQTDIAAVEEYMRIFELGVLNLRSGENEFVEPFFSFDSNFFTFFDYPLISGAAESVLKDPMNVVLSESLAKKVFDEEDPIGKTIEAPTDNGNFTFVVSGIMQDMPENSHLHFDMIVAHDSPDAMFGGFMDYYNTNWESNAFTTYLKLTKEADIAQVGESLNKVVDSNRPENPQLEWFYGLQALGDIHFESAEIEGGMNYRESSIGYVYIFSIVGFIILTIAFTNYINLSSIHATDRIKEMGLRKVVGASRLQLISQFLAESIFYTLTSFLLAFTLIQALRQTITRVFESDILQYILRLDYMLIAGGITLLLGLLAGYYPALIIMKSQTTEALKSQTLGMKKQTFFKGVVFFQFVIALGMILATIVVYRQLDYINQKDLGYDEDGIALIEINSDAARENQERILTGFAGIPGVKSASAVSRVPAEWKPYYEVQVKNQQGDELHRIPFIGADENFLDVFEIELIDGRNFRNEGGDSLKIMINETLAEQMGIKRVEGQIISLVGIKRGAEELGLRESLKLQVIGIVKDFHFQSLRENIPPMLFAYKINPLQNIDYFAVKIEANNLENTMASLREVMKASDPSPFDYNFLDDKLKRYYKEDTKRSRLFIGASGIAIFIAFTGLFALVQAALRRRVKELGIRRVLGAGMNSLALMLGKDYLLLLGIASLVACPLAYLGISEWLNDFAYKTNISWWYFGLSLLICLVITALATMSQITKAIHRNPSEVLRNE